ncbi:hypothetical protein NE865_06862 [Phthorimaea operculella]|nr:hypothetical protein NE865_06862 [Phthorimaea operculella]
MLRLKTTGRPLFSDEPSGPFARSTTERRRKNLEILFNNTTIIPFKWKGKHICFYCGETFTEYAQLKKHTIAHGPCTTKDYSLKIIKGNHIEVKIDVSDISCNICNEPFPKFEEIVDHLIGKHKLEYDKSIDTEIVEYRLADCRCLYCDQEFSYFGRLVSHVNMNHPQNNFICNECGGSFNKKRDLSEHIRSNHKEGGYTCKQCSEVFETKNLLLKHQNSYHFRRCKHCSESFSSKLLLQKHMELEHPNELSDDSRQCKYCMKEVHTKQGLRQHLGKCKVRMLAESLKPPENESDNVNLGPRRRQNVALIRHNIVTVLNTSTAIPFRYFTSYVCFYCTMKFVDFEELRAHTLIEHPVCDLKSKCVKKIKGERTTVKIDISAFTCKVCSQPVQSLEDHIDHITNEHNIKYDRNVSGCFEPFKIVKENIPCLKCPLTFRYFGILLRHINSTHSGNKGICDFCGRSFKNVANLKVHINHAHTDSIECDVCSAKFRNQWCLSRHKAKNHDAKDFKCPKCPEKFQSQYQKQKHLIKIHGEGHKCMYCHRMFTRNSFMKDHIRRTHLKEKNVPCTLCNEKFFDNYLLKMHMAKHSGDRKYVCGICGKTFLRKSNLYSHNEMHKKYGHVQNESNINI